MIGRPARGHAHAAALRRRRGRPASERRRPRGARDREPHGRAGARPRRCAPEQPDAPASGSPGGCAHRPLLSRRVGPARRRLVRRLPASGRQARHGDRRRCGPGLPRRRGHGAAAQRAARLRARRNATARGARAPQQFAAPARARAHGNGPLPGPGSSRWIGDRVERWASPSPDSAQRRRPGLHGPSRIAPSGGHPPSDLSRNSGTRSSPAALSSSTPTGWWSAPASRSKPASSG